MKIGANYATELDGLIAQYQRFAGSPSDITRARNAIINLAHLVHRNETVRKAIKQTFAPERRSSMNPPTPEMIKTVEIIDTYTNHNSGTPLTKDDVAEVVGGYNNDYMFRGFLSPMTGRPMPGDDTLRAIDEVDLAIFAILFRVGMQMP